MEGLTGADAHLGRIVAGLPLNHTDFSVLPPHFVRNQPTPEELKIIFPQMETYDKQFLLVLPFLVASVVFVSTYIISFISLLLSIVSTSVRSTPRPTQSSTRLCSRMAA